MALHHVDLPEQVVTPGEELWVKIIDIDLQRRRISLSIKQAAEGGEVAAEYREHFGDHAYDEQGNYIGAAFEGEFTPETEAQAAWAEYLEQQAAAEGTAPPEGSAGAPGAAPDAPPGSADTGDAGHAAPAATPEAAVVETVTSEAGTPEAVTEVSEPPN
jgi:small subunit ribosomal protein S1